MEPGKSAYELDLDTLLVEERSLKCQLVNTDNGVKFILTLVPLKDGTVRLRVEEESPMRQRFTPPYVLNGEPVPDRLKLISKSDKNVLVAYGSYVIDLEAVPFKIDISSGESHLITANARGLFRFEHTRPKPGCLHVFFGNKGVYIYREVRDESEDPGVWEENFKSHQDNKPYGPTAVAMDFTFHGAQVAYGLPEHADSHALRTTTKGDPYRFYNLDVFEYELKSEMALYASIPLLIAHSPRQTSGVFWLNPSETWVDIVTGNSNVVSSIVNFVSGGPEPQVESHFMSESGNIDVFFLLGPKPQDVFFQYSKLTGTAPIPPYFSLGFHQCRWNYIDEADVDNVHKGFDEHDMPMDVMWLDIEHTDNKKYFTWDPFKFPTPVEMQQNLTAKGRKLVAIVDPHIKRDPGYFLHNDATNNGYYVKNKDNSDYEGWCWSGSSSYLDFLNPAVQDYYSSRYKLSNYQGSTENLFIWNDMNEPSVFNGPEITMPKDNVHYGGWEHREVHNIYGLLQVVGTYNGLVHRSDIAEIENTQRPFILTRSAFSGSQRYAAIWTGDNAAEWSHLAASLSMCLSLAVGGMSFCGADVAGFFNNPDRELFVRWYQAAAFLPFFRAHAHIDTKRREPWLFDDEVTRLVRDALRTRYSYLPLWYTLFYGNNATGAPVIRPMWVEFPADTDGLTLDDQLLVGDSLLVRPVTEAGASQVSVYFPGDKTIWYDVESYQLYNHGKTTVPVTFSKIPVFQRGGSIVPKKERVRRSSQLMHNDPYTLIVALDSDGKAEGYLYIDDGYTHRYIYRRDSSVYIHFRFADGKLSSNLVGDTRYSTPCWLERVVILGMKPGPYKAIAFSCK
ncbi:hypothetical protein AAG570_001203 [Ranatra chinensis]|uniref:Glucosidase II subunit alpha n=1 Tax=Ranatra chinensis TaxID=642074 RepID=A0ABD0YD26_9HEMI